MRLEMASKCSLVLKLSSIKIWVFFNHSVVFKALSMTNYLTKSKKILHDKIVFEELSETIFKTVLTFLVAEWSIAGYIQKCDLLFISRRKPRETFLDDMNSNAIYLRLTNFHQELDSKSEKRHENNNN